MTGLHARQFFNADHKRLARTERMARYKARARQVLGWASLLTLIGLLMASAALSI